MKTSFVWSKYWANKFVNPSCPISLTFNFKSQNIGRSTDNVQPISPFDLSGQTFSWPVVLTGQVQGSQNEKLNLKKNKLKIDCVWPKETLCLTESNQRENTW